MDEYIPQPRWVERDDHRGWRGVPITAAEDFAAPYEEEEEDWEWDLLGL